MTTHNFSKILSFLLILLLLTPLLFACGSDPKPVLPDDTDNTTTTSKVTEPQETDYRAGTKDRLPSDLDFGGATINILCRGEDVDESGTSRANMYSTELTVEDLQNEVLNDAIYNRKIEVENRLNVELNFVMFDGGDPALTKELDKCINSSSNDYQINASASARTIDNSIKGWFYDLYNLEYLDFDQPWWYQSYQEAAELNGHLYCADGALSLSSIRTAVVVYFNKKLAEDHNIENIYDIVNAGDWTVDKQAELAARVYVDSNGNSEHDDEDIFGFIPIGYWGTDTYLSSLEINILSRDEDGQFFFDCDYDRFMRAFEAIYDLFNRNPGCRRTYITEDDAPERVVAFASGRGLMLSAQLYYAEDGETLRSMPDEYGILPQPKLDKQQKAYHNMPSEIATVFSIPVTNPDPDTAAAVLEALNAESYRRVISAYADIALKGKYMNDPESRQMFDLILENISAQSGQIYCYQIGEFPQWCWRYPIDRKEEEDAVKKYNSFQRKLSILLKELNESDAANLD